MLDETIPPDTATPDIASTERTASTTPRSTEIDDALQGIRDAVADAQGGIFDSDTDNDGGEDDADAANNSNTGAMATDANPTTDPTNPGEEDGDPLAKFGNDRKGIRELRDAYKNLARERKEQLKRLQELEQTAKQAQEQAKRSAETPATPISKPIIELAEKYSAEKLLTFIGKYEAGQTKGDPAELAKLHKEAQEALELKSPDEIYAIVDKARQGGFGDLSRDILTLARETLATVQYNGERRKKQVEEQGAWQRTRNESVQQVVTALKLKVGEKGIDTSTPEGAEFTSAMTELATAIPHLNQVANAPQLVAEYVQMRRKVNASDALAKENAELKAKLARLGQSLPTGTPSSPSGKRSAPKTPEQELRASLAELGFGGG